MATYFGRFVIGSVVIAGALSACGAGTNSGSSAAVVARVAPAAAPHAAPADEAVPNFVRDIPPGLAKRQSAPLTCNSQLAHWSAQGNSVSVHIAPPFQAFVDVTVEANANQTQAADVASGGSHDFTFNLPPGQVKRVNLRINEAGCDITQQ